MFSDISLFTTSGYFIHNKYATSGLFYAKKDGLIATSTFGSTKLSIRCSGSNCTQTIIDFETLLINNGF